MNYTNRKVRELLHTPEGVRDSFGAEYHEKQETIRRIADRIHLYGYRDIQTPSFEFFDVFSNEIGTTPSKELYKFFDSEGNTLALRPDFTPSVARCAAKYFMDEKAPIRFCYQGNTFINTHNLQGKRKEMTQMGAELMNDGSSEADGEMISMLIESLLISGLKEFQISVGNVEYFRGLCESLDMSYEMEMQLREEISGKNYYAAENLLRGEKYDRKERDIFLRLQYFMNTVEELEKARDAAPGKRAGDAVQRLIDVWKVVDAYGLSRYVNIDLSLLSKYHYYTGVIFKGYTYGIGEPVASGGRYDQLLEQFGKRAPAIGFMLSIDSLMDAMHRQHIEGAPEPEIRQIYYTPATYREALSNAQEYRRNGIRTELLPKGGNA